MCKKVPNKLGQSFLLSVINSLLKSGFKYVVIMVQSFDGKLGAIKKLYGNEP